MKEQQMKARVLLKHRQREADRQTARAATHGAVGTPLACSCTRQSGLEGKKRGGVGELGAGSTLGIGSLGVCSTALVGGTIRINEETALID
eukprot:4114094-Pyramimonas_sp.AAC.1